MLAIIFKASDSDFHDFKEVKTIEDLFNIAPSVILEENEFNDWTKDELLEFWNITEEEADKVKKAQCQVTIYDDYVE